jgi:iron-sulfur cluster assembly protein
VPEEKKILPLSISDKAYQKILEIKKHKNISDDYCLRLGVKSAGCGVASYMIGFDHRSEKDELFLVEEIQVIIEKLQLMYLAGKIVDFDAVDGQEGFVFRDMSQG